jgi:hypothetical protein
LQKGDPRGLGRTDDIAAERRRLDLPPLPVGAQYLARAAVELVVVWRLGDGLKGNPANLVLDAVEFVLEVGLIRQIARNLAPLGRAAAGTAGQPLDPGQLALEVALVGEIAGNLAPLGRAAAGAGAVCRQVLQPDKILGIRRLVL